MITWQMGRFSDYASLLNRSAADSREYVEAAIKRGEYALTLSQDLIDAVGQSELTLMGEYVTCRFCSFVIMMAIVGQPADCAAHACDALRVAWNDQEERKKQEHLRIWNNKMRQTRRR